MAVTLSHVNDNGGTSAGPYTLWNWTPTNGTLYLVFIAARLASDTPPQPTCTGNSQTWELVCDLWMDEINHGGGATGNRRVSVFACKVSGATAGNLVVSYGAADASMTDFIASVESIAGADASGINGMTAFVQYNGNVIYQSTANSIAVTFNLPISSGNAVYACGTINTSTGLSAGAGFTGLFSGNDTSGDIYGQTEYESAGPQTPTIAVNTGGGSQNFSILAIEIGTRPAAVYPAGPPVTVPATLRFPKPLMARRAQGLRV